MRLRPTYVSIDRSALRHNLALLRRWTGSSFLCPMIKANAYGHGEELIAAIIEAEGQANAVGVARLEEALKLRRAGVRMPILVFAPLVATAAKLLSEHQLTPVIGRFEDFAAVQGLKQAIDIHLKFNTGMQRVGFDATDLLQLRVCLNQYPVRVAGLCTHLSHGEEVLEPGGFSQRQIEKFRRLSEGFPGIRHLHKSASLATLQDRPQLKEFGARPGIALYGLPHEGRLLGAGLRPVLSWHSEVSWVHRVEVGQSVGYGARWTAKRTSTIGVVPVGYADGYSRALSPGAQMLWRGKRVPLVGSVCMDYTLLDLTDAVGSEPARPGEPVVMIGRQGGEEISAAQLAEWAGTIAYEVVTAISDRVPREAV